MCDFRECWFGASEPDGFCVDGYLQDINHQRPDLDCRLHPCPRCNTYEYLLQMRDEFQRTLDVSPRAFKSASAFWTHAKKWAKKENPHEAKRLIAKVEAEF